MMTSPDCRRAPAIGVRPSRRFWSVVVGALLAFAVALAARAQSAGDPPTRVARLSDAAGQVWLYTPDSNEWLAVARNRPLTTGDRVATDNGARAEVTLGTTTLRLDAGTELEIVRLDDTRFHVRLHGGSVAARLRNPQALAEFELTTDEGRFRTQTVGRYRFDRFDQASDVTVFNGQAVYEARNTALPVTTGQHAQFWIDAAGVPQYATMQPARDEFAAWNDERDRAEDRTAANRYVSPEMTGAEDLDRYGRWQETPEYGALWVPREVPIGWAPYSTGHWAWVRPWGWTWVDDAPWGFAPFHYGRWVYHRNVWCWAPGRYVARPVYAPALVAWIGGPRVNVSVSIGGGGPPVGWFPLAPREVYVPSYRHSPRYVRDVNYTHVTNVTNITTIVNNRNGEADRRDFANRKFPHAVTIVPSDVMLRRQPVAPVAARLRNDPQVRSLVADASPAPVVIAPPVTAPAAAPRPPQGRPPPRPPFEARAPGGAPRVGEAPRPDGNRAGGRPDGGTGARGEFARPGPRPEVAAPAARPEVAAPGVRPEAVAPPVARQETPLPVARPDSARPEFGRGAGGRQETGRGGERGTVAPTSPQVVTPQVGTPQAGTPQAGTPQAVRPPPVAPPVVGTTPAPAAAPAGPPVGARGMVEPSTGRPVVRGGPAREGMPAETSRPEVVVPPSPVQRNAQPGGAPGRPAFRGREALDDDRGGPKQATHPGARNNAIREMSPATREALPVRPAPVQRPPETAVVAPAPPQRPPAPAVVAPAQRPAPPAAVVAPPAAPPAAQRAPGGEQRMTRPEPPRREERRDERRDERGEKQR